MAYIGREPQIGNYQVCDAISVVNAQAAYTMQVGSVNVIPESVNHMIVSLNGVIQKPGSSYTISSSTITFSSNLATGDSIDFIYLLGNVLDLGTPSDDTVTGAKIVDNAINSEHYTDASVDLAHLSADSVDGSKIVDNAINSEHYTDGSIDTAHIAADQITNAKIADDQIDSEHYVDGSIDTAHIADNQITLDKLAGGTDGNIISYDASGDPVAIATGNDGQVLTSAGAGAPPAFEDAAGGNTPYFEAYSAGDEDVSDSTITKATLGTEAQDSDGKFASSRFTPTVAGRYYIEGQVFGGSANGQGDVAAVKTLIYFNGSAYKSSSVHNENSSSEKNGNQCVPVSAIITFDTDDYVELYGYVDKGSSQAKFFAGTKSTYLLGYKIG